MIQAIKNNKFYSNSLIFLIGSAFGGLGSYAYNFLMARMLGAEGYGELQSVLALIAILGIPLAALSTVIIKCVAGFAAQNEQGKIAYLLVGLSKKIFLIGTMFFILFLIIKNWLSGFLNLTSVVPLIVLAVVMLVSLLSSVNNAFLQGLQKFKQFSIVSFLSVLIKILLGYYFVKFGFYVSGALGAVALSGLAGYVLAWLPLKFLFSYKNNGERRFAAPQDMPVTRQYLMPVFVTFFFMTWMMNIDIILVKHFFNPAAAGQYAALAVIGHIIFFVIGPLVAVMFPMSVAAHTNQGDHRKILKNSAGIALVAGMIAVAAYFLLPRLIVKIIVGSQFLEIAPYLGWFGLAMLFYSLVYLISQYLLAINQTRFIWLLAGAGVLQLVLILIWHASIWQLVWIMDGVMGLCLILLIIYRIYARKKDNFSHCAGV